MNKSILFYGLLLLLFSSCKEGCQDCVGDGNYPTKAIVFYINDTDDWIISESVCDRDIAAGDTLIITFDDVLGVKPSVDAFPTSVFYCSKMQYKEGLTCEDGINNIQFYEDRKEVEPLVFEFTFRFTEEKKMQSEVCD
ncbi:hypothetical protein [Flammeovirga aprica]|uniref:Lipoprotein n=1 Tax=Flammeovirga aprica JL-4 TaxID=694437 RepID=A0A7X9P4A7_9BACT|nr:hypothetical protein [Flammeovirga aprica]NME68697.1 hypothetical protein [Flammeovirga aprica JL-4]